MMTLFLKLVVVHCVADYPLQGDFLATAKNHKKPIPGVPWYQALGAHAAIQAGGVWLVTGSLFCAGLELVLHAVIDWLKSEGLISFNQDQSAHLFCKLTYVGLISTQVLG